MGGHLGVVSPAMKAYGQEAKTAGGKISGVDLSGPAGKIGTALPGGTAGGAASGCALNQGLPNWGKAIAKQGGKVAGADSTYFTNEGGIEDLFGQLMSGTGGGQ